MFFAFTKIHLIVALSLQVPDLVGRQTQISEFVQSFGISHIKFHKNPTEFSGIEVTDKQI